MKFNLKFTLKIQIVMNLTFGVNIGICKVLIYKGLEGMDIWKLMIF